MTESGTWPGRADIGDIGDIGDAVDFVDGSGGERMRRAAWRKA
ncbi:MULTISPECIES: hypothetical protein [Streptomyces]|nr:hypothetical protein [Streptomyces sp. CS057]